MTQTHRQLAQNPNDARGTSPMQGTVCIKRILPGSVERLWSYLTEADKQAQWMGSGIMEPRVGGTVELAFDIAQMTGGETTPDRFKDAECSGVRGVVTCWDPPKKLSYTWAEGDNPSEVVFDLVPQGSSVELTVTHRNLTHRSDAVCVACGWHSHLALLIAHLNGTQHAPFWPMFLGLEKEYEDIIA